MAGGVVVRTQRSDPRQRSLTPITHTIIIVLLYCVVTHSTPSIHSRTHSLTHSLMRSLTHPLRSLLVWFPAAYGVNHGVFEVTEKRL